MADEHTPQLTEDERTFLARALPHYQAGKTLEEAARAVLDDDARLYNELSRKTYSLSYGAAGDGGPMMTCDGSSSTLAAELSRAVYDRIRAAA